MKKRIVIAFLRCLTEVSFAQLTSKLSLLENRLKPIFYFVVNKDLFLSLKRNQTN